MSGHRGHMCSHSPGRKPGVLVPDGEVDPRVLAEFPLAETLEVVIETGTALEHGLPQRPHHCNKNLIMSSVTNRQVEPHALRGRRLTPVHQRLMRLKNRSEVPDLRFSATLTGETGNLNLDDPARLQQIMSHALIDRGGEGGQTPIRRWLGNKYALSMPDFDFAQQFETVQSLTKRGTPDSQFRGQFTLWRNTCPFWQAANDVQKLLSDNLRELGAHGSGDSEGTTRMARHITIRLAS